MDLKNVFTTKIKIAEKETIMNITLDQKVRQVLKSLMRGIPVKIGNDTYGMDEEYDIMVEAVRTTTTETNSESSTPIWMKYPSEIKVLVGMCKNMSEEDYITICANLTLNELR